MSRNSSPRPPQPLPTPRSAPSASRIGWRAAQNAPAARLSATGLVRGDVVAVIGHNSGAYLVSWMAPQFAGLQAALINPAYPDELLGTMLDNLAPRGILWVGRDPGTL